jgi:hypothetical protein
MWIISGSGSSGGSWVDATYHRLLDKIGVNGKTFVTDDWEGYHRLIPENQLFTAKDLLYQPTDALTLT